GPGDLPGPARCGALHVGESHEVRVRLCGGGEDERPAAAQHVFDHIVEKVLVTVAEDEQGVDLTGTAAPDDLEVAHEVRLPSHAHHVAQGGAGEHRGAIAGGGEDQAVDGDAVEGEARASEDLCRVERIVQRLSVAGGGDVSGHGMTLAERRALRGEGPRSGDGSSLWREVATEEGRAVMSEGEAAWTGRPQLGVGG